MTELFCAYCNGPITGLFLVCQKCNHVYHPAHAQQWFSQSSFCPSGCQCECVLQQVCSVVLVGMSRAPLLFLRRWQFTHLIHTRDHKSLCTSLLLIWRIRLWCLHEITNRYSFLSMYHSSRTTTRPTPLIFLNSFILYFCLKQQNNQVLYSNNIVIQLTIHRIGY